MVHQHFTAIPALTVGGERRASGGMAAWAGRGSFPLGCCELAMRLGLSLDPDARTEELTVGARQRLEIMKALAADATLLLLDEPTAVLAPPEADDVLRRLRSFAAQGGAAAADHAQARRGSLR